MQAHEIGMDGAVRYPRRKVTVLSADVVGYSRMVARDDVQTVADLDSCSQVVTQHVGAHHGRQFGAAGDSYMIEFPEPLDAVRCGLAIQAALKERNRELPSERQMWLRMGVETSVAVDDKGVLHGDGVNVAVRLQEACPRGGVLISRSVCTNVEGKVDAAWRTLDTLLFKNIQYPVEAIEVVCEATAASQEPPARGAVGVSHEAPTLGVVDLSQPVPGFGDRPALAVLPFENMTGDAANDYLSDGLSEDLITGLSHLRWFPVIDRGSSFTFRGTTDMRSVGQRLGARYLLAGSLRVIGDRLRIVPRLVDSDTSHTLWTEQYDVGMAELVTTLDEVVRCIVGTLQSRIEHAEQGRARARRQSRLDVWSLIWRGRWHLNRLSQKDMAEAKRLFDEALELDPYSTEAIIQRAFWQGWTVWSKRADMEEVGLFRELAGRALKADDLDSRAHMLVGIAELYLNRADMALPHLEQAVRLNPSLAQAHAHIGTSHLSLGDPARALAPLQLALRLNPQDLHVFYIFGDLAASHLLLGDWQQAIAHAERSLSLRPSYWYPQVVKIGALARQGDLERATAALEVLMERWPKFSRDYIEWLPFKDRKWHDHLAEGLAMALPAGPGPGAGSVA